VQYETLKLFVEVAEVGTLSKVAALRHTTQPHISRQIRELERECGGALFKRTGRGVVLSDLGERIMPKVRSWLAETQQLEAEIRNASGEPNGVVRIGILPSAAHPLASSVYRRLRAEFPSLKLVVREGQGAQLESWLADGSADLALLCRHGSQDRDGEKHLLRAHTYLVGPAGDKLTSAPSVPFSCLDKLPLVQFCRPNSWRDQLDEVSRAKGVTLNTVLEADSLRLQLEVVAEGGGYALLGPCSFREELRAGRLQVSKVTSPALTRHVALSMPKHGPVTRACRIVIQIIENVVASSQNLIEEI